MYARIVSPGQVENFNTLCNVSLLAAPTADAVLDDSSDGEPNATVIVAVWHKATKENRYAAVRFLQSMCEYLRHFDCAEIQNCTHDADLPREIVLG